MSLPLPGPPGWPWIGNAFQLSSENLHLTMADFAEVYGDIMQLKVFGKKMVVLNSADLINEALTGDEGKETLNDRPDAFLREFFPDLSLALSDNGPLHDSLRTGFHKALRSYGNGVKTFEDAVQKTIKRLLEEIESYNGEEFDFTTLMKSFIASQLSVFFSEQELDSDDHRSKAIWNYIDAVKARKDMKVNLILTYVPLARYIPGVHRDVQNSMTESLGIILEEYFTKVQESHKNGSTRGFVDGLLNEQRRESQSGSDVNLTDNRIKGTIGDVVLGACATMFSIITSAILCVINQPDIQRKARAEIHEVIGKDRLPTLDDMARCPYTEAVIIETLRYISVAPLGVAHSCKEQLSFKGFNIPANTMVLTNIWYIHHDEKIWGDPWNFRPERFLDDQGQPLPWTHTLKKNWIPFGVGRRQCIGDKLALSRLFLYFSSMIQRLWFVPVPGKCGSSDPRSDQFETLAGVLPKTFYCRAVQREPAPESDTAGK